MVGALSLRPGVGLESWILTWGSGVPKSRRINLRAGQVPWSCHHSPLRLAGIFAAIHTFTTSSSTGHSSRLSGVKAVLMSRLRLPFFPGVL